MKFITAREKILNVAGRWARQYPDGKAGHHADVSAKLQALNPATATAAEVNAIIGNDSWTTEWCDECGTYHEAVIQLGEDANIHLCANCAKIIGAASGVLNQLLK